MHPIFEAGKFIMRKLKEGPKMELMKCADCGKDIPLTMVVFVKPENVNKAMDGKDTPQQVLCSSCSPARGSVGCYYTLAQNVYEDLAAAKMLEAGTK